MTTPHRFTLSPAGGLGVGRAMLLLALCGWGQYAAWQRHRDADPAQIALVAGGILLATVMMGVAWGRLRRGGRRFTLEVRDGAATLRRADGTFPPPTDLARLHLQAGRWTLRSDTGSAVIGPALTMRGDGWPKVVIGCAGGKPAWAGNVRSVSAPTHTVPATQWPTLLAALHLDPGAPPR